MTRGMCVTALNLAPTQRSGQRRRFQRRAPSPDPVLALDNDSVSKLKPGRNDILTSDSLTDRYSPKFALPFSVDDDRPRLARDITQHSLLCSFFFRLAAIIRSPTLLPRPQRKLRQSTSALSDEALRLDYTSCVLGRNTFAIDRLEPSAESRARR
jgi:hypothetical protein